MNRVYGLKEEFALIRSDGSRRIVSYGIESLKDSVHATWYEIYFYKKSHPVVTFEEIKDAIIDDIDEQTRLKILRGFMWNSKNVWLSADYQRDFADAQQSAKITDGDILPLKLKLGKDAEGNSVYHTFTKQTELNDFYLAMVAHIQKCREDGWILKDSINWDDYKIPELE